VNEASTSRRSPIASQAVLVVDDVRQNLELTERTLSAKLRCTCVLNAEEALELIRANVYAAIVSDHKLPGMTGVQLLAAAATIAPDTARILVTGYADLRTTLDAVNTARVAAILTKPVDPKRLLTEVEAGVAHFNSLGALRWSAQAATNAASSMSETLRRATPGAGMPIVGRLGAGPKKDK
jgi:response regulator RpfG family c-di-GMP phosphodiesterase